MKCNLCGNRIWRLDEFIFNVDNVGSVHEECYDKALFRQNHPLRILIINDYATLKGGTEKFIFGLKKALEKRGHKAKIFGSEGEEDFVSLFSRWYSFKWYNRVIQEIRRFKPDAIHINNCARIISPSVINASLRFRVPVIVTFHDWHYLCPRLGGMYKRNRSMKEDMLHSFICSFNKCQGWDERFRDIPRNILKKIRIDIHGNVLNREKIRFTSPSKVLANDMERFLGSLVRVQANGVEFPRRETKGNKSIIFVGDVSKEKGLQTIIRVLDKVQGYDIFVVGDGKIREELEGEFSPHIQLIGHADAKPYYEEAAIMVAPSIWMENFPYTVIEAMSYGICVIGSDSGGIPEQIKHMETGLIFKRGSALDFKRKLYYLLGKPSEIKRLGRNARKYAKENFNWNDVAKSYEEIYIGG